MEVKDRAFALKAVGKKHHEIAEILRSEGFKTPKGKDVKTFHISNWLHTASKSTTLSGSKAERLATRSQRIEEQIKALREQQLEEINDLPRLVFNDGETAVFELTPDGGLSVSCSGAFDLNFVEAGRVADFIRENF